MITTDIDLAADESPRRRAVALFGALFAGFVGLFFIAGPITASMEMKSFARDIQRDFGPEHAPDVEGLPWFVLLIFPSIGLLVMVFSLIGAVRVFRSAAWLNGTTAYVRGALRTRSIDLSRAYVSMGSGTRQAKVGTSRRGSKTINHIAVWEVPTLEAQDPVTGKKLTIQLARPEGGSLPPYALRALAEAMVHGRGGEGNDRDVHNLAQRLRVMADEIAFETGQSTGLGRAAAEAPPPLPSSGHPAASDPWLSNAPGYGDAFPVGGGEVWQASAPTHTGSWRSGAPTEDHNAAYSGTPDPMRRESNTGLLVTVAVLTVLLVGGLSAAGLVYISRLTASSQSATADDIAAKAARPDGGGSVPGVGSGGGPGASGGPGATGGSTAGNDTAGADLPDDEPLPSGKTALVTVGANQVRIKIDKIKTHSAGCSSIAFPPDEGYYITARVTYQVVKGSASVGSLSFSYLDDDGRSYSRVPAGFSGCGGDQDLDNGGPHPAGSKGTGFISFDGPAKGTIVFTAQSRQYAWKVG